MQGGVPGGWDRDRYRTWARNEETGKNMEKNGDKKTNQNEGETQHVRA